MRNMCIFGGGFLFGVLCCPFFLNYVTRIARPVLLKKEDARFPFWRMWACEVWAFCVNLMEEPLKDDCLDRGGETQWNRRIRR